MSGHNNDITDLREILFDTLRDLKEKRIDIDHAKAISETAQVIINSAKVEVDHARHTGGDTTSFLRGKSAPILPPPGAQSYQHKAGERHKRTLTSVSSDE